jgi:purine nucleosidase
MPLPIVLDTDIGTDIDDAYALLLAAISPEAALMGVSTVNNDTVLRARIARKLLNLLGRNDVAVVAGRSDSLSSPNPPGWMGPEGMGIELGDVAPDPIPIEEFYAQAIGRCPDGSLSIVTIGPLTNIAWLLDQIPSEMRRAGRIVSMASTWNGWGDEHARREHNVACDPEAFERILQSGLPLTIVGLNVTTRTSMSEAQLDEIETIRGPLAKALSGMHRVWFDRIGKAASPMHDALAVAAAFDPEILETASCSARTIDGDGAVAYNRPADDKVTFQEVALGLDLGRFESLFWSRTLDAVAEAKELAARAA